MALDQIAINVAGAITVVFGGMLLVHFYYLPKQLKDESAEFEAWQVELEDDIRRTIVDHSTTIAHAPDPTAQTTQTVETVIEIASLYSTVDVAVDMLSDQRGTNRTLPAYDFLAIFTSWATALNIENILSSGLFQILLEVGLIVIVGYIIVSDIRKTLGVWNEIQEAEELMSNQ